MTEMPQPFVGVVVDHDELRKSMVQVSDDKGESVNVWLDLSTNRDQSDGLTFELQRACNCKSATPCSNVRRRTLDRRTAHACT